MLFDDERVKVQKSGDDVALSYCKPPAAGQSGDRPLGIIFGRIMNGHYRGRFIIDRH